MNLWKLTPKGEKRSENWSRSSYKGDDGPVIVRAASEDDARGIAAAEFEQSSHSPNTLFNPWSTDTDTDIVPYDGDEYPQDGKAEMIRPKRP